MPSETRLQRHVLRHLSASRSTSQLAGVDGELGEIHLGACLVEVPERQLGRTVPTIRKLCAGRKACRVEKPRSLTKSVLTTQLPPLSAARAAVSRTLRLSSHAQVLSRGSYSGKTELFFTTLLSQGADRRRGRFGCFLFDLSVSVSLTNTQAHTHSHTHAVRGSTCIKSNTGKYKRVHATKKNEPPPWVVCAAHTGHV